MRKTSSRMVAKTKISSNGNNTKENDKVALAHGLFEICDSLKIICDVQRETIEKLEKIDAPGVKTHISKFSQVLKSIEIELVHTDRMLLRTGMKSVLKQTKETNQAQENQKLQIQNAINASKGLPSIDIRSNFERMKRNSSNRNNFGITLPNITQTIQKSIFLRFKGLPVHMDVTKNPPYYTICENRLHLKLQATKVKSYILPLPNAHGTLYGHREFMLICDDLKDKGETGLRNLLEGLNAVKLLLWGKSSFEKLYMEYTESGRDQKLLPPPDQIEIRKGRKRYILAKQAVEEMNSDIHFSPSEVRDPMKDARRVLAKRIRSTVHTDNMQMLESFVNRTTASNYSFLSILNDTDVVLTSLSAARLKSEAREIASKSWRTLASHACGIICSQFRVGPWRNKPKNLSKGAKLAYRLAQIMLDCPDVYPIHMSYILSYDAHGYRYTKGIGSNIKRSQVGKISLKHGNLHERKKHLSNWSSAEEGDNMFKSINVKEHEINSANGARGRKCIQISVTREQCPSGFLTVHVPGLGAGLDMKPNWDENDYGILMFVGHEKGRINTHLDMSKKRTESLFYQMYPDKDSPFKTSRAVGTFQDLDFIPILHFKEEDRVGIQNLFYWSDDVIQHLERKNVRGCNTPEDKKHRLVCYMFETILQLCLDKNDNVSQNPGCESFCGVWNIANNSEFLADLNTFRENRNRSSGDIQHKNNTTNDSHQQEGNT